MLLVKHSDLYYIEQAQSFMYFALSCMCTYSTINRKLILYLFVYLLGMSLSVSNTIYKFNY